MMKVCNSSGCPTLVPVGVQRCDDCSRKAERKRGTPRQRGYGRRHRRLFREPVLARDPICVLCYRAPATEADHFPLSRDELVAAGLDPDDPRHGRGLCHDCHSRETAKHQPGGWAGVRQ